MEGHFLHSIHECSTPGGYLPTKERPYGRVHKSGSFQHGLEVHKTYFSKNGVYLRVSFKSDVRWFKQFPMIVDVRGNFIT